MFFLLVVGVDNILVLFASILKQFGNFRRWILKVIVHSDNVLTTRIPKSCHNSIMLTKITRQVNEPNRKRSLRNETFANLSSIIFTAIINQNQLMSAFNGQIRKLFDQTPDSISTVVDGNNNTE